MYSAPTTGIPVSSGSNGNSNTQPPPVHEVRPKVQGPWSTGLFDCFSDWKNCCITMWCPCITFGRIVEIVDMGSTCTCVSSGVAYILVAWMFGCPCLISYPYRSKIRQEYTLKGNPCGDCLVHCFCEPCALCQEYRELQFRGFDMSIGWHKNAERQNRGVEMAPVVEGGMSR